MRIALPQLPSANLDNGHGSYTLTLLEQLFGQQEHTGIVLAPDGWAQLPVPAPHALLPYRRRRLAAPPPLTLDTGMELTTSRLLLEAKADVVLGNAQWPLPRTRRVPRVCVLYETELLGDHPWGLYDARLVREGVTYLKRNLRNVDAVVAISEHVRATAVHEFGLDPARVTVGPPALRPFPTCVRCPGMPARPYVAVVGWFHPRKDLPLALQAWREAFTGGLDHDLVLIGEESSTDHVHGSVARRVLDEVGDLSRHVHLAGPVSRSHLGHLVEGAGALLVSSLHEGFGIPVVEAFSLSTPVVAVDRASLREVVAGHGAVVPATPAALAEALLQTVESPNDPAAARMYAASFTRERQMRGIWAALKQVMSDTSC